MTTTEDRSKQSEMGLGRILNKDLFVYLVDLEVKRARRYQNFYCVLLFKMKPMTKRGDGNGTKASFQILTNVLTAEIRESDIVGLVGENRLAMMLPYADVSAGGLTRSRLEGLLAYYDFGGKGFDVSVQQISFPINGTNVSDLVKALENEPS
jgi:hypothetical protein